jgi:hypothetical protein
MAYLVDPVTGIVATMCIAGDMAVRATSASFVAAATASIAATVGRTTTIATAATTFATVATTVRGSSPRSSRAIVGRLVFGVETVGSHFVCWGAAMPGGFLVFSSGYPIINAYEVGLLFKLSYEVSHTTTLRSSPYPVDGHEALVGDFMSPCCDFVLSVIEVAYR